ncbi:MAG: YlxR family protein [Chloroflexi bacterium]|nr:MAG: YlxR family protein [Chloroflexota bacterium]TMG71237.1 MAG: YlxR family protein [Chloroflexota bacterium]
MKKTARSSEPRRRKSAAKAPQGPARRLPQRTCVACRTTRAKRELVRVVRSPQGELSVDLRGKAPGRGAYLCADPACLELGLAGAGAGAPGPGGTLAKALEVPIDTRQAEKLRAELAAAAKERRANA